MRSKANINLNSINNLRMNFSHPDFKYYDLIDLNYKLPMFTAKL